MATPILPAVPVTPWQQTGTGESSRQHGSAAGARKTAGKTGAAAVLPHH